MIGESDSTAQKKTELLWNIALAILALNYSTRPGESIYTNLSVSILVPYWSLGVANNIFMTLLITYRILSIRYRAHKALSPDHLKIYFSVSAVLIESAALYSTFGIIFVVFYATNSNYQGPIAGILDQVVVSVFPITRRSYWGSASSALRQSSSSFEFSLDELGPRRQNLHWRVERHSTEQIK